jgi:hypothetical protein
MEHWHEEESIFIKTEIDMRIVPLIVAILVVSLLAVDGTVSAMALTHSGLMGNGYGNGMMGGRQEYQRMM